MKPAYEIHINGTNVSSRWAPILLELQLIERPGDDNDSLDLTIDNRNYEVRTPQDQAEVQIWLGYEETGLVYKGKFVVDSVTLSEPNSQMTITCKPPEMVNSKIKSQRNDQHHDTTLKKTLEKIGKRHKLQVQVHPDIADKKIEAWHQNNESDLHTMRRLARRHGANIKVADGKLAATKRGSGQSASGQSMPQITVYPEGLNSWRMTLEGRPVHRTIVANWKDHVKPQRSPVSVTSDKSVFAPVGGSGSGTVGGTGGSGGSGQVAVANDEPRLILGQVYPNELEALKAAESRKSELSRGSSSFSMTCQGVPQLGIEAVVITRGFPGRLDGVEWVVSSTKHILNNSGYTTTVECEKKDEQGQGGQANSQSGSTNRAA